MADMGPRVEPSRFSPDERARFCANLARETELLDELFVRGAMSERGPVAGLEIGAWLIDGKGHPAPCSDAFLKRLCEPAVAAGALRASVAIRVHGRAIAGDGLPRLEQDLARIWARCADAAREMGLRIVAVGILPSLCEANLRRPMLSEPARQCAGQPPQRPLRRSAIRLDIEGDEGRHLRDTFDGDVLPEFAASSISLRLRLPASRMRRIYNASIAAAAPLVAMAGNSPLLFGQPLWQDTRIPLLEQAHAATAARSVLGSVLVEAPSYAALGHGWACGSPLDCFRDNLQEVEPASAWPLPQSTERFAHLRAQCAAAWRWNQPGIGFDADGRPHFRLDHGTLPSGPGIGDMLAQVAVALGVFVQWARAATPPESRLPFADAAANLQAAARSGLAARLRWFDGREASASDAARDVLRDARAGLACLEVDTAAATAWLDRIGQRIATHRTAARWMLARLQLRRGDLAALTLDYAERQASNEPVHAWA